LSPAWCIPIIKSWVEKANQLFLIVLAQRCAHAHVAHNGSGDSIGKAFWCVVAAGAVLLEDTVAFIIMMLRRVGA
jgi:hypothetical protein